MCAYSLDLRERVVLYIESGNSRQSATEIFNIGERTIERWFKLKKENKGSLARRPRGGGRSVSVSEVEFKSYVKLHPDSTLEEIGKHFKVSASTVWYNFHKYGYVHKKKHLSTQKGMRQKELNTLKG